MYDKHLSPTCFGTVCHPHGFFSIKECNPEMLIKVCIPSSVWWTWHSFDRKDTL